MKEARKSLFSATTINAPPSNEKMKLNVSEAPNIGDTDNRF